MEVIQPVWYNLSCYATKLQVMFSTVQSHYLYQWVCGGIQCMHATMCIICVYPPWPRSILPSPCSIHPLTLCKRTWPAGNSSMELAYKMHINTRISQKVFDQGDLRFVEVDLLILWLKKMFPLGDFLRKQMYIATVLLDSMFENNITQICFPQIDWCILFLQAHYHSHGGIWAQFLWPRKWKIAQRNGFLGVE